MNTTFHSEVGALRRVVLKHARDAFVDLPCIEGQWRELGYLRPPDYERAVREYDDFLAVLGRFEIERLFLPLEPDVGLDSLYVRTSAMPLWSPTVESFCAIWERPRVPVSLKRTRLLSGGGGSP